MYTIKDIATLCIENDVDFEIWHGEDPRKVERAAMLINLNPAIRIDFGDKKHNQRISRIHLAGNHKVPVKEKELVAAIKAHELSASWNTGSIPEVPAFEWDFTTAAQGHVKVRVSGEITVEPEEDETFTLLIPAEVVRNYYSTRDRELLHTTAIPVILRNKGLNEWQVQNSKEHLTLGQWINVAGQFTYPNIIEAESMGVADGKF